MVESVKIQKRGNKAKEMAIIVILLARGFVFNCLCDL